MTSGLCSGLGLLTGADDEMALTFIVDVPVTTAGDSNTCQLTTGSLARITWRRVPPADVIAEPVVRHRYTVITCSRQHQHHQHHHHHQSSSIIDTKLSPAHLHHHHHHHHHQSSSIINHHQSSIPSYHLLIFISILIIIIINHHQSSVPSYHPIIIVIKIITFVN